MHTHHQWLSIVTNVAEEAVVEELMLYIELFTINKVMKQLIFVFTVAANLVMDELI